MESDSLWGEILPIGCAILLYGLFEGAEMALLSAQKNRLQQWKEEGRRGAADAFLVHDALEPYLATVQIVKAFVGVAAMVAAGAVAVADVAPRLALHLPFLGAGAAVGSALVLTIVLLTYALLLGGHFVPRAIAQHYPEYTLCQFAPLILLLTRVSGMIRSVLRVSLTVVLWVLGQRHSSEPSSITTITEEAVTTMVREGAERGHVVRGVPQAAHDRAWSSLSGGGHGLWRPWSPDGAEHLEGKPPLEPPGR